MRMLLVPLVVFSLCEQIVLSDWASIAVPVLHAAQIIANLPAQEEEPDKKLPSRNQAPRIKLFVEETREITHTEAILSVTVMDTQAVAAEKYGERSVRLTGLARGETVLILFGRHSRHILVVEVARRPVPVSRNHLSRSAELAHSYSGFYGMNFSPALGRGRALLRQRFAFQQNMGDGRLLRASGELFNFFGGGEQGLSPTLGSSFGANRITLGIDSGTRRLDLLDSELNISRLSFRSYTMRGMHLVTAPEASFRGIEVFAGIARPAPTLFNEGSGRVAGVVVPVLQSESIQLRTAAIYVSPGRRQSGLSGGIIWQMNALYTRDEKTKAEAEVAYTNGGLSWRVRADVERDVWKIYGESSYLDSRSPLISIGAQTGGRRFSLVGFQWKPRASFGVSSYFNRSVNIPSPNSRRVAVNNSSFFVNVHTRPTRRSPLTISYLQQALELPVSNQSSALWNLDRRSLAIKHSFRFNRQWSNNFEARLSSNRESNAGAETERGFSFREQLRYSWRGGSVTGYINHKGQTPSLTGLVMRNPSLLPTEVRQAFFADPVRFLLVNRDLLPQILPGIELPQTRSTDVGGYLQARFKRFNVTGHVRHSSGEILAQRRRDLLASLGVNVRLDAANSLQVSAARNFAFGAASGQTALTISYVHRFGAGSGGGFQLAKLFGADQGRIQGRVFMDLNGNGLDDPEEPGVAGIKVQIDGRRTVMTDTSGKFSFGSLPRGEYNVAVISDELGVRLRANTSVERLVSLSARQTVNLSFGLSNAGFIAGRIFNDIFFDGEQHPGGTIREGGVKLYLRSLVQGARQPVLTQTLGANGLYEFRNLAPGQYVLELDPKTLPPDFKVPAQTSWPLTVQPLQGFYLDIPIAAQRAVSGIVFVDEDGDGQFNPQRDRAMGNVLVIAGRAQAVTSDTGAYTLRSLPAGKLQIRAQNQSGEQLALTVVELGPMPAIKRGINLIVKR